MALDDLFTVSLLHMEGNNNSPTFLDESRKLWTTAGSAVISTAQKKFGNAAGYFNASGDYIYTSDSADWRLDGGSNSNSWTIDLWFRFASYNGSSNYGFVQQWADGNNYWVLMLYGGSLNFYVKSGGSGIVDIMPTTSALTTNTWYHLACVKQGTTGYKIFLNGTQQGSTVTDVDPIPDYSATLHVGSYKNSSGTHFPLTGWMDEVRISKGIARWTSNFTPPAKPYGIIKNNSPIHISDYGVL